MLDNKGFDLWADGYDKTVGVSEEGNTYPFAGYKDVLGTIFKTIMKKLFLRSHYAGSLAELRHPQMAE